ncbi:MAG: DUF5131 family protein [Bacillota bacterium]
MGKTNIEWTEYSWNPVVGCSKVSDGCTHCYAEKMAWRLSNAAFAHGASESLMKYVDVVDNHGHWNGQIRIDEAKLGEPLRWKKPRRVFVNSMGDLFHESVPDEFIARVWWVMGQCAGYLDPSRYRGHIFIILTKRPQRMKEWIEGWADQETRKRLIESFGEVYDWMNGPRYWPAMIDNVWLGVTAENQEMADQRIPILLQTQAAVRFVSIEPILGPVDLNHIQVNSAVSIDALRGIRHVVEYKEHQFPYPKIDWIVTGAESGPYRRLANILWFRNLRDQCMAADIPFFLKQMEINDKLVKMPELEGQSWAQFPQTIG